MKRYAVKVGGVRLRSDEPITDKERTDAIAELSRSFPGTFFVTEAGVEVRIDWRNDR